jgi:hypothetical protein
MLTKIFAALAAAIGIGVTGVYFATAPGDGAGCCPLSRLSQPTACPLSEGTCDTEAVCTAPADATDGCPSGKCAATTKVSAKLLATAALGGSCAVGTDCCQAGAGCCEKE